MVFQLRMDGRLLPLFEEQVRMVSATDSFEAFLKASQAGHRETLACKDISSQPVNWKFIDVVDISPLEFMADGAAIQSCQFEQDSVPYLRSVAQKANRLLQHQLTEADWNN